MVPRQRTYRKAGLAAIVVLTTLLPGRRIDWSDRIDGGNLFTVVYEAVRLLRLLRSFFFYFTIFDYLCAGVYAVKACLQTV